MAEDTRLGVDVHYMNLKAPVDSAGTAFATNWIDLKNMVHYQFIDYFGVVTATSTDQPVVVTIEAATAAASGAEVAVSFKYRQSGAVTADTLGAVTAATSTGVSVGTDQDGTFFLIDIDVADLERQLADARFIRLVQGIDAGGTVTLNAILGIGHPRNALLTHQSAT